MNTLDINLNRFVKHFRIGSFDTDYSGKVKMTSICNYLQEIAGMHAEALNWGINDLMKQDLSWVLSRLKIKVFKYPQWKDNLRIETWPTGIEGLFGNREFKIVNEEGTLLMIASSSWLIINIKSKRPVRPHEIIKNDEFENAEKLFEQSISKIKPIKLGKLRESIKVHYSDIDINQHVNNVKYIKWIIDSCPKDVLYNKEIEEMELNFLHEAKFGDQLIVNAQSKSENEMQFSIQNQKSNIENCRAILNWK